MITTDRYSMDHFTIFQYNNSWNHTWNLMIVDDYQNNIAEEVSFDRRLLPIEVMKYLKDYVEDIRKDFI